MKRHEMLIAWRVTTALLLAALTPAMAQAAPVNFTLAGMVTFADAGNDFGLSAGDSVSLTGTYDDSDYDGIGLKEVSFGDGTGNTLQVNLGSIILSELNDVDFFDGLYPSVTFFDGSIVDTDILIGLGVNGSPVNFGSGTGFEGADANGLAIEGRWEVVAIQGSVPEPGSLALAGTAAVVCGLYARRGRQRNRV